MNMTEHLLSRWFDQTKYPNATLHENQLTLPLYNMSGKFVGYQTYNPTLPKLHVDDPRLARYFTWVTKPCGSKNAEVAVWGLETVNWYDKVLFLTEGVFDACRLHWHGFPAVAVLSNNPVHLRSWLKALPSKKVACVQGDAAGMKLAKFGDYQVFLPAGKDVGDLTESELEQCFARFLDNKVPMVHN
jgi:hypothetical protein